MEPPLHIPTPIPVRQIPTNEVRLTRRRSLQWLGAVAGAVSFPLFGGCEPAAEEAQSIGGDWPSLDLEPITATGYGTDPNLVRPTPNPWPLTLSEAERDLVSALVDILVPGDGEFPPASEVGVTELLDEWVSAPYPRFQADRVEILSLLVWLDEEAIRRFGATFLACAPPERLEMIDDIAFESAAPRFTNPARVFAAMRTLVVAGYFASPEGALELGYQGNVPIVGDYPGPSLAAKAHLQQVLGDLGLAAYAYDGRA